MFEQNVIKKDMRKHYLLYRKSRDIDNKKKVLDINIYSLNTEYCQYVQNY